MPRMFGYFIHHVHIADGFADDCEELIHRCVKHGQITYQVFCTIWKEMNFADVYQGRMSGAEISELTEELLYIAKHYMVANTSNFEESVAGVFLVYGLYHLQPMSGFAVPRLVPGDITALARLERVARRDTRLDVLYALGDILARAEYHAEERSRGIEVGFRKYFEGYTGVDQLGVRPKGVFFRQNEEQDLIRELALISRKYGEAKAAIVDGNNQVDRSLQYTDPNLASDLDSSLRNLINGIVRNDANDAPPSESESRQSAMSALKSRAARAAAQPVRHLTTLSERQSNKSPKKSSPKKKSELKPAAGTVKSGSPKKPITSGSPKKRKPRKRKEISSDSDTEDEVSEEICDDLDLNAFDKEVSTRKTVEVEVDINTVMVDKLADVIQGPEGIEIEIVDHMKRTEKTGVETETVEEPSNFKMPNIVPKSHKRKVKATVVRTIKKLGLPGVVSSDDTQPVKKK